MQQVKIDTPAGWQHFQPQNQFESYHAETAADGTVDVVLSISAGDGSPDQQNIVASFPAEQVHGVTEAVPVDWLSCRWTQANSQAGSSRLGS